MRPLVIANIDRIEGAEFLVAQLFGEDGYLMDTVIKRHESDAVAIGYVKDIAEIYGCETPELWTSTREIYVAALNEIGLGASLKHRTDTSSTRRAAEELQSLYADLGASSVELPRWKTRIIIFLKALIQKLGGKVENGI
ncbi:hypothetical protein [Cohnella phaseoli]|uniref:Uncharacterized protein n=1 Tax=Cohnella phaseoli TaxID=456490 RepID=A0A3D9KJ53_9BACL|nr:hypothetical protein [Cohnella phaseoli]RED86202.1 hypothetical protein DFP98_10353 [Cohnella phaseoli]